MLPAPAAWPFGEGFPRTSGTGRLERGALLWTDFVYDDHGADGIGQSSSPPRWPRATAHMAGPSAKGVRGARELGFADVDTTAVRPC